MATEQVEKRDRSMAALVGILEGAGIAVADYHVEREDGKHPSLPSAILLQGQETEPRPALKKLKRATDIAREQGYPVSMSYILSRSIDEAGEGLPNLCLTFCAISSERGKAYWGT